MGKPRLSEKNGFGIRSLRVEEAWLLYGERYPTPPDNRVPSGGWRMAPNGIPVPPVPRPGSQAWTEQQLFHRRRLSAEDRASAVWRMRDNDDWWNAVFQERWEADMRDWTGYVGGRNNTEGRDRWWVGDGRTLDAVLDHIRAGGERLEMPPSPPPSPPRRLGIGRTNTASSSRSSS